MSWILILTWLCLVKESLQLSQIFEHDFLLKLYWQKLGSDFYLKLIDFCLYLTYILKLGPYSECQIDRNLTLSNNYNEIFRPIIILRDIVKAWFTIQVNDFGGFKEKRWKSDVKGKFFPTQSQSNIFDPPPLPPFIDKCTWPKYTKYFEFQDKVRWRQVLDRAPQLGQARGPSAAARTSQGA